MFVYESTDQVLNTIAHREGPAPMAHWMEMPDIGHVIATRYCVLFTYYSLNACSSFLPLVAMNGIQGPETEVTIFFLQDMSHYISVSTKFNEEFFHFNMI